MSFAKKLIRATKSVNECLENSAPDAPRESKWLARGLKVSCETIRELLIDTEFRRLLDGRPRGDDRTAAVAYLRECEKSADRLEEFLAAEHELFIRAGVPATLADTLIQRCRGVVVQLRYENVPLNLGSTLTELRSFVCERSGRIGADRRRRVLGGMSEILLGITGASLNGGLLAATVGLSGAASAASMMVGGVVAADGFSTIRNIFG